MTSSELLADSVSPPVHLHALLTAWQFGDWTADVALFLILAAGACYAWGARRLRSRGRPWPRHRIAGFFSGLAVLVLAVASGLASYDDSVFTVHVIQHVFIMMVGPPLLSLGAPITLALQASSRPLQSRISRLLRTRTISVVTMPFVTAVAYYASMWIDMQTSFYPYSLQHPLVHDASHFVLLILGCLFWWPLVAIDELPHRPEAALRLGLLFVGIPSEAFLGISTMSMGAPIAPEHTLSDTHTGGAVFWVASMAIMFAAAIVIALQWMNQEERRATRADRRADQAGGRRTTAPSDAAWEAAWISKTGSVPTVSRLEDGQPTSRPGA